MGRCIASASLGGAAKALHLGDDPIVFCGGEPSGPVSAVEGLVAAWKAYGRSNDEPEATRKTWPDYSGNGNDLTIEMEFTNTAGWHDNAAVFENGYAHGKLKETLPGVAVCVMYAPDLRMKNSVMVLKNPQQQISLEQMAGFGSPSYTFVHGSAGALGSLTQMPRYNRLGKVKIEFGSDMTDFLHYSSIGVLTNGYNPIICVARNIGGESLIDKNFTYTADQMPVLNNPDDELIYGADTVDREVYVPGRINAEDYSAAVCDIRIYGRYLSEAEEQAVYEEMQQEYLKHFPQA